MKQLPETGQGSQTYFIRDGDVIYQPRAEFFFVMGEVNTPGS